MVMPDNRAFAYTLEAIIAGLLMVGAAAYFFAVYPQVGQDDTQILQQSSRDILWSLYREGTLEDSVFNSNWSTLDYKINNALPQTMDYRVSVYNSSERLWNSSKILPSNKKVVGSNLIVPGAAYGESPREIRLSLWFK